MQLGYLRLDWQSLAIIFGAGIAAVVALFALRRIMGWILGPIFVYETTRLARKGHTFWLRCLFALGVLALLFFVAPRQSDLSFGLRSRDYDYWELQERGLTPEDMARDHAAIVMARFAQEFSNAFLLTVGIGVVLVTPLYMATAISEEKEKRCIDFLLATHLTNYEIVMGKLAARFLNLLGILLPALPILAVTQVWGGVDVDQLAKGFVAIVMAMLSYSCVSLFCSAIARRTRNAVILAYVFLFLLNLGAGLADSWDLSSPVGLILHRSNPPKEVVRQIVVDGDQEAAEIWFNDTLTRYCYFHLFLAIPMLSAASLVVRRLALKAAARVHRVYSAQQAKGATSNRPLHPLTIKNNPPIGDQPLVWKERYLGRTFGGFAVGTTMWMLLNMIIFSFFPIMLVIGVQDWQKFTHGVPMRVGLMIMGVVYLLAIGMRMASCITREREQDTMLSLLTLPVRKIDILRAKWLGALFRSARPMLSVTLLFALTVISAALPVENFVLLIAAMAAHIYFAGNLGLMLSVFCRSSNRAFSFLLMSLLLLIAGSWIVSYLAEVESNRQVQTHTRYRFGEDRENSPEVFELETAKDVFNPVRVWWRLTSYEGKSEDILGYDDRDESREAKAIASIFLFFFAGTFLYYLAWLRFRKEGSRG